MPFQLHRLRIPVIAAPMAGGVNTPALAAAVANAGGVGSFGFAYSSPEKIEADLVATKRLTSGPINANFFVFAPVVMPDTNAQNSALEALRGLPHADQANLQVPQPPFFLDLNRMLAPVWRERPAMVTFHFGIPSADILQQARSLDISVGITATNAAEAIAIEHAGADFVVAQGIEAGGHRGIFTPDAPDDELSIDELVRALTPKISIPVVAAGGLMNGRDIQRVMSLGAVAAQLGSAFLGCDESGASPAHKNYLQQEGSRGSEFTKIFSGRRARGIRNEFMRRMQGKPVLPFPVQNIMTAPLRSAAAQRNDGEYQSLWAGMNYAKARPMPAAQLMETLAREIAGQA
jgi:nitronate monooxygenase